MQSHLAQLVAVLGPYEQMIDAFEALHLPRKVLGTTLFETEIVAYYLGDHDCNGLIAAGAHAEEVAGVATAYSLAHSPPAGIGGWVIPCRDPLGWDGFQAMLRRVTGADVFVTCHQDAVSVLRKHGELVVSGDITIGIVDNVAFFSAAEHHPAMDDPAEYAYVYFADNPHIAQALAGKRLFVHGSPKLTEGRSIYEWGGGPTIFIDSAGRVGNFNRFFASDNPPPEVAYVRKFLREAAPKWCLDLHEGFGASYFVFSDVRKSEIGTKAARAMVQAVTDRQFPIMTREELAGYLGVDSTVFGQIVPGAYYADNPQYTVPDAFCPYASAQGALCFTTEMGMENSLAVRIEMTEASARACIEVLRNMNN